MQDIDVPYNISLRVAERVESQKVVVKLIKDANHRLSREEDLLILYNSIEELLKSIEIPIICFFDRKNLKVFQNKYLCAIPKGH